MDFPETHLAECDIIWKEEYFAEKRKEYESKFPTANSVQAFMEFCKNYAGMVGKVQVLQAKEKFAKNKASVADAPVVDESTTKSNSMKLDAPPTDSAAAKDESSNKVVEKPEVVESDDEKKSEKKEKKKRQQNPAKRAKTEKTSIEEVSHDFAGWAKVCLENDKKKKITMEKMIEYFKEPKRAQYFLACIVAYRLAREKTAAFNSLLSESFFEEHVCDGQSCDAIVKDFSKPQERGDFIKLKIAEIETQLRSSKPDLYGSAKTSNRLTFDKNDQLRKELCRSLPFLDAAPYAIGDLKGLQVYVFVYQLPKTTSVNVVALPSGNYSTTFDLDNRRAFVNCLFSSEVDQRGVALADLGAIGEAFQKDLEVIEKKGDVDKSDSLFNAYMSGNSQAVFNWFKTTFPQACDEASENHLKAEHFALTANVKNLEKYNSPTTSSKTEKKQTKPKSKSAAATSSTANGDVKKIEAEEKAQTKNTIEQFAVNVNKLAPKKTKIAQNSHFLVLDKSNDDHSASVEYIMSKLAQTGLDEELKEKFPLRSKEDVLSIVMPHTTSKAANSMSKKGQSKKDKATGTNDDAAGDAEVPESAREQYQAYSAQIPTASRTLFMGNDLTNKLNNLPIGNAKPTTKASSDAKVNLAYARSRFLAQYGVGGAITDGAELAKVLDGVVAGNPESVMRLLMAKTCLYNYVFRISVDAQSRNEFKVNEDQYAEYFGSDAFVDFLASCLILNAAFGLCCLAYNTESMKKDFANAKALTANIDVAKGWF